MDTAIYKKVAIFAVVEKSVKVMRGQRRRKRVGGRRKEDKD